MVELKAGPLELYMRPPRFRLLRPSTWRRKWRKVRVLACSACGKQLRGFRVANEGPDHIQYSAGRSLCVECAPRPAPPPSPPRLHGRNPVIVFDGALSETEQAGFRASLDAIRAGATPALDRDLAARILSRKEGGE